MFRSSREGKNKCNAKGVRHHCNITDRYKESAHNYCNLNAKEMVTVFNIFF